MVFGGPKRRTYFELFGAPSRGLDIDPSPTKGARARWSSARMFIISLPKSTCVQAPSFGSDPKGPCTSIMVSISWYICGIFKGSWGVLASMVYTWGLKGILFPYFGVYVSTMMKLGPFGLQGGFLKKPCYSYMCYRIHNCMVLECVVYGIWSIVSLRAQGPFTAL